jgi:hypothetical protein
MIIADMVLRTIAAKSTALHIVPRHVFEFADCVGATLGNKQAPTFSEPADLMGGRSIKTGQIVDGEVTGQGVASHWALVNEISGELLHCAPLDSPTLVKTGNVFTLNPIIITIETRDE